MEPSTKPNIEGIGDASVDELLKAAQEEARQAEQSDASNIEIGVTDEGTSEDDFYEEFLDYFNATSKEIEISDIHDNPLIIKVERLGIFHLRKYQKKITATAKRLSESPLPMDVQRNENNEIISSNIIWSKAWPIVTDIIIEELLDLVMDSCAIKNENGKFVKITEDQFNNIGLDDFPFIIVPWIDRNFADPKKRAPWQRMVMGLLRKFGVGSKTS